MEQKLLTLTLQNLEQAQDAKLVVIAPRLRQRSQVLAALLEPTQEIIFFAVQAGTRDLQHFLETFVDAARDLDPKFGAQTTSALKAEATPEDLADAFVADLGKAKPKPRQIVLDTFDHLKPTDDHLKPREDVQNFFDRVVRTLPNGMQLIINGRTITYTPWAKLMREGYGIPLGDEYTLDNGILDPNKPESPQLEVYALSTGSVYVNGAPLTTWDGPLPRNLFYFFVDHPMVTRNEIFETFWPDLPTKEATNVFHVTKRKISERLGYELTAYSGGFYRPSGQMAVHYDAARFEKIVEDNKLNPPNDPAAWYEALRLYRSPFLCKIEMQWMVKRREQLRLTYAEALIGIARLYRALKDDERAISFYLRALREVPQREDVHRDLMSLYDQRGEPDKAVRQYEILAGILERSLNITPSKITQAMFKQIREHV